MRYLSSGAMLALVFALSATCGCGHRPPVDTKVEGVQARAPIDSALGEVREPHEDERTEAILQAVKGRLVHEYPPNKVARMPRDAHQKMHGCLVGTFHVRSDLDPSLQVGLFSTPGASHPVIARFSNSDANPQPDKTPDARGLALKVLGVSGQKLIADETSATTHDFMLINAPTFFVRNLAEYVEVLEAIERGPLARNAWLATHPHALDALLGAFNTRIANPVEQTYFSATPYAFGRGEGGRAAKYRVRPCTPYAAPNPPDNPSPSFLREAMKQTLATKDVCFEFSVQRQTNAQTQPVEDATVKWNEDEAPFERVATLQFPAQDFDRFERKEACRKMSFTPWHALADHKPLGSVNRARLRVYELISRFRNAENSEPHREPVDITEAH